MMMMMMMMMIIIIIIIKIIIKEKIGNVFENMSSIDEHLKLLSLSAKVVCSQWFPFKPNFSQILFKNFN